jgi:sugar lactone lactonase YvrE
MAEPQLLFDYTGHLPECPTWSEEEQALYWADILEGEIHRYHLPVNTRCFVSRGGGLFCPAREGRFYRRDAQRYLADR